MICYIFPHPDISGNNSCVRSGEAAKNCHLLFIWKLKCWIKIGLSALEIKVKRSYQSSKFPSYMYFQVRYVFTFDCNGSNSSIPLQPVTCHDISTHGGTGTMLKYNNRCEIWRGEKWTKIWLFDTIAWYLVVKKLGSWKIAETKIYDK